ncbi:FABP family protein [uncultured Aeromicrobium sp.]|uniref:FABP family protein n=1 Tax=uncultured Aeromicrobium sp. TaxID=337820 RepID=UPI0025D92DE0|nr:FABP family protein [uncultured Aeromicrobium sp.]
MAFEIPSDLHPDVMPLAWLLGHWHGNGRGDYPTIEAFGFEQDVAFTHDTRPFLHYFSQTWVTDDEGKRVRPGALETGFLRAVGDGKVEMVLAHPTGYAEIWYGEIDGPRLTLTTDVVARTETAKEYTAGQRMYGLVEGNLMYAYDMAAEGHPLQSHLWGKLARV